MDLLERAIFLLIGNFIGFVLGYVVRSLQEIKEELNEVDEIVKRNRNDEGFVRHPFVLDAALIIVVLITVWAAFASQAATNNFRKVMDCNNTYNQELGEVLSTRDEAVSLGVDSEIRLWAKYNELYEQATTYPERIPALQEKLDRAIDAHRIRLEKLQEARNNNPYPSHASIKHCKVD